MAFESKKEKISKVLQEEIKDPKPQRSEGEKLVVHQGRPNFLISSR